MVLEIITPDKVIFNGEVSLVQLSGMDGLFEILKNHAPLIASLKQGKAKVEVNGENQFFNLNGGIVEVRNNKVLVLSE